MELLKEYYVRANIIRVFENLDGSNLIEHKVNLKGVYGIFINNNYGIFKKHAFFISKGNYKGMFVVLGVNEYAADEV